MENIPLELATIDDLIAELAKRPNERPWILLHQEESGRWTVSGKPSMTVHDAADTLHHFLGWMLLYMRASR